MKKKTILVTGALGHIGSRLIRELPDEVGKIIMLDNLDSQRHASLFQLPDRFTYVFIEGDIRKADYDAILPGADAVIHLAANTNAEASHELAEEVRSINLEGAARTADACLRHGVRVIFPSTTSVYGSQAKLVDETCKELAPQSPYAGAKLEAERYMQKLAGRGLKAVIFRFGTIFGPSVGMRFHTAVNKFIWQAATNQPITVWKTAWEQKRPYLDLSDCIAAVNLVLSKDIFDGEIYNVVTRNFAVKDIVEAIKLHVPDLAVSYVDSPIMNQLSYEIDGAKFGAKGFVVRGDLSEGVKGTFDQLNGILRK